MHRQKPVCRAALLALLAGFALAQGSATLRKEDPPTPIADIIQKFAEKEKQFKAAQCNYSFRRDVRVQQLDNKDRVTGEYQRTSNISFDASCNRVERVLSAPRVTLQAIAITPED